MAITHKVFSSRNNNLNSELYVGEAGRLFYEQPAIVGVAPVLKYSDGSTPGGLPLSGSSLTFSSSTAPANPQEGNMWWNTTDGRLYIYYDSSWVDASPEATSTGTAIPQLVSYFTNDIGYLTSSTIGQYIVDNDSALHGVTGPVTVTANAYTLNLGTCNGMVILDNSNANFTLTIQNPIVGKIVRVIVAGGMNGPTTVTVSGLTAANSSNGAASFQATSGSASSVAVEFICTTTATSGVYMVCTGAK